MKKKVVLLLMTFAMSLLIASCGNSGEDEKISETKPPVAESEEIAETEPPAESDEVNKPGPCTLPSGFEINLFYNSVRNDVTGNWRLSASSSSIPVSDCAMEYYSTMFSSDDEIHGVWNATLGTTTCIKAMAGLLFVDTYEYVDGEEHDAKIMFSGMLLDSKTIDIATGEEIEE